MKQAVVVDIARSVLTKYKLDDWKICLDVVPPGARKRMAQTRAWGQEVGIVFSYWRSKPDTAHWRDELRSLVLHEVAHIIAGISEWHGDRWRDTYIDLLKEWFDPKQVVFMVSGCSEISEEWIVNEWLTRNNVWKSQFPANN